MAIRKKPLYQMPSVQSAYACCFGFQRLVIKLKGRYIMGPLYRMLTVSWASCFFIRVVKEASIRILPVVTQRGSFFQEAA